MSEPPGRRIILNFHGIGEPSRELEPGEAPYWLGVDRFRRVVDAVAAHPHRQQTAITFDDGNLSDLVIAAPCLQERGLAATFFVLTGRFGGRGSLDRADVRELRRLGMGIGSHGTTHRDWTALSGGDLDNELTSSKHALEDVCGHPIEEAAIPFGRYNRRVLDALRGCGYRAAYSSDGGSAKRQAYPQPRLSLRGDLDPGRLVDILNDRAGILQRSRRSLGMLRKRIF